MAGSRDTNSERFVFLNVLFLTCVVTVSSTAQVPLLIWSTESLPPLAPPAAGHITSLEELGSYLSSAFGSEPHTVLLFLQTKLSKEDFAVFGGVYGNKEDGAFPNLEAVLQTSSSSLSLPAVEWLSSSGVPALLQEKLGVSPVLLDADTLAHLGLETAVSNLLLINLPYCSHSKESCKQLLRDNDGIIGNVVSSMKARKVPYVAMYTGLQPSRVLPEFSVSDERVGRSLLQTVDVRPPIMFNVSNAPCIMLWAETLNVAVPTLEGWIDLAAQTPSLAGSSCNSSSSQLVLNYPSGITLSFFMSQRFYPVSRRNWFSLDSVRLQANSTAATFNGSRFISAPAEYSYRCQSLTSSGEDDALLVLSSANQSSSAWRLHFVDFQIQGFGLANGTDFSYASDCAGFFTPGIWMGLVSSLILLLTFVYGLHMIMQMSTMDRFDDPKGPSISVPQTE